MRLHTASETVSFQKQLEEESAEFYQYLSKIYGENEDIFLSFYNENKKYVSQTQRVYFSVISDAFEGGYAFDLDKDNYTIHAHLSETTDYSSAIAQAISMEEIIRSFYEDAAEQSMSLMADLPRNFKAIAKKRIHRISKLKMLLQGRFTEDGHNEREKAD